MINEFKPMPGAAGWQLSNPSVLATVALLGSLKVISLISILSNVQLFLNFFILLFHLNH